jgi:Kef-type K+ transport system membrane component KefB
MHQVSKILFCHETLLVLGIFSAHLQELSTVHMATGMFHAGYVAAT